MLLYPGLTQLDLTGPLEVLHRVPGVEIHLVWKTLDLVEADSKLKLAPNTTLDGCPPLDVLFVPGGAGQVAVMQDDASLRFLRAQGDRARFVTAVCTGSLLLGVAGLLEGYEATTHWAYMNLLPLFGARPVRQRVVVDRNRMTGGGVTAGIDFGLRLAAILSEESVAKGIQLGLEYDPQPPFASGHPDVADPEVVARVRERFDALLRERGDLIERIVARARAAGLASDAPEKGARHALR
jgi:cyclohexyl-isocyanide hydratase